MHNNHETVIIPQTIIAPTKYIVVASLIKVQYVGTETGKQIK